MKYSELTINQKINFKGSLLAHTNFSKTKIFKRILSDEIKVLETRIYTPFGFILITANRNIGYHFCSYKTYKQDETN